MNHHFRTISLGAVMSLAAAGAISQTAPAVQGASAPNAVGVTPQEAGKANQQAIPRSDTATVVRTAPSPAARASESVGQGSGASSTSGAASQGSMAPNAGTGNQRAARADRN